MFQKVCTCVQMLYLHVCMCVCVVCVCVCVCVVYMCVLCVCVHMCVWGVHGGVGVGVDCSLYHAFHAQFTGQPAVLYYAPLLFKRLGIPGDLAADMATVGLGIAKVLLLLVVFNWLGIAQVSELAILGVYAYTYVRTYVFLRITVIMDTLEGSIHGSSKPTLPIPFGTGGATCFYCLCLSISITFVLVIPLILVSILPFKPSLKQS